MARRNHAGLIDTIFAISVGRPWWVSVLSAIVAYVGFGLLASHFDPPAGSAAPVSEVAIKTVVQTASVIAQHVLPVLFLFGAGHSLLRASTRRNSGQSTDVGTPTCPGCGAPMVLRLARRGANAGKSFWGCSSYPKCWGVREHTA